MSLYVLDLKAIQKQTGQKALDAISSTDAVFDLLDELKQSLLDDMVAAEEGGQTERLKGAVQAVHDVQAIVVNLPEIMRNKR